MTQTLAQMDLTASQSHIMCYLAHCPQPPCSHDVEQALRMSHPTVSGLLIRMEKKGFVRLAPDPQDRRCKRIYLLQKGEDCRRQLGLAIDGIERRIVRGFTLEEQQQFAELLERAIHNMGHDPANQKEEHT